MGKTTVAASMAIGLSEKGFPTGFLDADLTGPNALDIFGEKELLVVEDRFQPSQSKGICYVSLAQIISRDEPVLWRDRDFKSAAKQLLERTDWKVDYLVVDFPPGTGSEPQALIPMMDYVVIVTIPSHLAESNVRRCINMCREHETPILGLVKNMTYYECECGRKTRIFPEDHGFEEYGIPVLTEVPLRPGIAQDKLINGLDVDRFLEAMGHPVVLKRKRFKRGIVRLLGKTLFRGG